jgi:hypothetical protein
LGGIEKETSRRICHRSQTGKVNRAGNRIILITEENIETRTIGLYYTYLYTYILVSMSKNGLPTYLSSLKFYEYIYNKGCALSKNN